jgi:O-antigen ligase
MSICAPAFCILAIPFGRAKFIVTRELIIVLLLTAWFSLGVPFAYWRGGSLAMLTQLWLRTLLFFFALTQTLTTAKRIRIIVWVFLISELIATSASLVLQGGQRLAGEERLVGVNAGFFGWNYLGIALSVSLPYMAALYIAKRSLARTVLLLATAGTSMWMLVLVASRGGFLNVVVAMFLTGFLILRGTRRARWIGVVLVIAFAIAIASAPGVFWQRIETIWGSTDNSANEVSASARESTDGRERLLQNSLLYTIDNPVFGVGIGNFPIYNGKMLHRADAWYGTHNTYTQASAEAGIPALLLLIYLLVTMLNHSRKAAAIFSGDPADQDLRLMAVATLAATLSAMFGLLFMHILYDFLIYYIAAISGALWAIASKRKNADVPAAPAPIGPPPLPLKGTPAWR